MYKYTLILELAGCQEDFSSIGVCQDNPFKDNSCKTSDGNVTLACYLPRNNEVSKEYNENMGGKFVSNSFCFISELSINKTNASYYNYNSMCY